MQTFLWDLRYAARVLRKNALFTAVAIVTLALGIGANTAIFSVLNAVILRPLPIAEADRAVQIWDELPEGGWSASFEDVPVSHPNFQDYAQHNRVFQYIAGLQPSVHYLVGGEAPSQISTLHVSPDFFPLLGADPILGRAFAPEEYESFEHHVAILSHGFWQRHFGADPDVVGKTVKLNTWWGGRVNWQTFEFTVTGVLPANLEFPPLMWVGNFRTHDPEILLPMSHAWSWEMQNRGMYAMQVLARLEDGVTVEQAQANMDAIALGIAEGDPETSAELRVRVTPLPRLLSRTYGRSFLLLLGTVGIVLLIACVNVANLMLARGIARVREFAIRSALGAKRRRLIRQLLTESLLLSAFGGALGLLLALVGTPLLVSLLPGRVPRLEEVGVDLRVLGFTLIASALTAILFGLIPAWQASGADVQEGLKEGSRGSTPGRHRVLRPLVVSEVGLALLLLISGGLMMNSFIRLTRVDPGFNFRNVLTMRVSLLPPPLSKYQAPAEIGSFFDEVLQRIESLPGVVSVAGIESTPLSGRENRFEITVPGRELPAKEEKLTADQRYVTPGYFRTMGIPLTQGRPITEQDNRQDTRRVAVINETMAREFWPNEDPIGKGFYWGLQDLESGEWDPRYPRDVYFSVIGVVGDVKTLGLDQAPGTQAYIPFSQIQRGAITLVVRTVADPLTLVDPVRAEVESVGGAEPRISGISTMEEQFSTSVAEPRFYMWLIATFAGLALVLAVIGLYGVISYSVSRRTQEIGIRLALGAQTGDVLQMIVRQGLALTLAGVGFGVAAALVTTRILQSRLFGVSAADPLTYMGVSALFVGAALLACYVPARRATKVRPMEALRYE